MKYAINPMTSVRYRGKPASRKRFHAAGFSRNAPRRRKKRASPAQLAARKKFAAMARARAGSSRTRRAHSSKGVGMARRKRKAVARRSTRRKRRVGTARRRVLAANPRRRRRHATARRPRRRTFRRNPGFGRGILGEVIDVTMKGGAVAVGRIGYNAINQNFGSAITSATDTPTTAAAKKLLLGAVVGVGIKMLTKKMGGRAASLGDFAAAGAVSAPMMQLLATLAPGTMTGYLGDGVMAMPRFNTARRSIGNYPGGVASYSETALGSYAESAPY